MTREDRRTSVPSGTVASVPFIIYIFIGLPPTISVAFFPSATHSIPEPHAQAVIRQYDLLFLSTTIVAALQCISYGTEEAMGQRCLSGVWPAPLYCTSGISDRAWHRPCRGRVAEDVS